MPKGYSLHIGVNEVDNGAYGKIVEPLPTCVNDANAMATIALQNQYTKITILRNKAATLDNFSFFMEQYSRELEAGDILLLSFSGHGLQLDTIDAETEIDDIDEGWCLYNKFIRDKALLHHFKLLKEGVRVLMISSSCFSGGLSKFVRPNPIFNKIIEMDLGQTINASGLLLAASRESEKSLANTEGNTVFINNLLNVWDEGNFIGDYEKFMKQIQKYPPTNVRPILETFGLNQEIWTNQSPFKI